MDALVLVGGYATRLQPLTLRTPKSLVPVAGKPALTHLFEQLKAAGVKEVLVSLNNAQRKVEEYFGDGQRIGISILYHYEGHQKEEQRLGAIGSIHEAIEKFGPPKMGLVLASDNYAQGLDFAQLARVREKHKAAAAIAFYELADKALVVNYGVAALGSDGRVVKFQEKPKVEEAVSKLASTAFYSLSSEFLTEHIPAYVAHKRKAGEKPDRLGDLFNHYVDKLPIYGMPFTGMWGDANTPETYVEMNKLAMNYLTNVQAGKGKTQENGQQVSIHPDAKVAAGAIIRGPAILEQGAVVETGALIGPYTHLLHHARAGAHSRVVGSIVFEHADIGNGAHVENSILEGYSHVGEHARIEGYSMLGYKTKVGAHGRLLGRSRVWSFVEVGEEAVVEGTIKAPLTAHEEQLVSSKYWHCV